MKKRFLVSTMLAAALTITAQTVTAGAVARTDTFYGTNLSYSIAVSPNFSRSGYQDLVRAHSVMNVHGYCQDSYVWGYMNTIYGKAWDQYGSNNDRRTAYYATYNVISRYESGSYHKAWFCGEAKVNNNWVTTGAITVNW